MIAFVLKDDDYLDAICFLTQRSTYNFTSVATERTNQNSCNFIDTQGYLPAELPRGFLLFALLKILRKLPHPHVIPCRASTSDFWTGSL